MALQLVTLNGIALTNNGSDVIWVERYGATQGLQSLRRTLGGRAVIYNGIIVGGLNMTLQASSDTGWIKRSVADQLMTLAEALDAVYPLVFNSKNYNVMFRHIDAPAIDLTPNFPKQNDDPDDYLTGSIKLITV